ncbi:MAG: cytochrome bc complex cytochrome b subunit [Candidatus Binatia bacterium]
MTPDDSPRGLMAWLDERYGVRPLVEYMRHKEVPVGAHPMFWYYLGGATLFFFIVQIVTGVLLLMYYQPGEATSYESIRYIATKVPFGWLVRSMHCWSAHLMIISLVVHMFSTMLLKAYRPPRELTWLSGYALFGIALAFGFSGYLLPWNELSYFATAVGTDSVKSVPVIGHWLLLVMRGGEDVTINTLYRFFAGHVVILPLLCFAIVGLHLLFIQRQGMAPSIHGPSGRKGMPFFPNFALRDLLLWLVCLTALAGLAVSMPYGPGLPGMEWELGAKADPLAPAYPGIKPEWYFLWIYQLLKEFPPHLLGMEGPEICLLVVSLLLGLWALIPWLDRSARQNKPSPAFTDLGIAAIYFLLFLTVKAADLGIDTDPTTDAETAIVARACAMVTLAVAAAVTLLRVGLYGHRWFVLSGAAIVHMVLHGLVGWNYLAAGTATAAVTAVLLVLLWKGGNGQPAEVAK